MISELVSQDASMTLLATKLNIVEYTAILVLCLLYQLCNGRRQRPQHKNLLNKYFIRLDEGKCVLQVKLTL